MENYIKEQIEKIEKGLINNHFEPIKCECGSEDFYYRTTDMIDLMEVEKDKYCSKCKNKVGHWAYGNWEI